MSIGYCPPVFVYTPPDPVEFVDLLHTLPAADLWVVQFYRSLTNNEQLVVIQGDIFRFSKASFDNAGEYRLIAFRVRNGGLDAGMWWVDSYVYDSGQVNIEFTNNLPDEGTGDPGSFSGTATVADQPAQRIVIATALDGESPRQLAQTVSSPVTGEYLLEWLGYNGQVLVTVFDDYGVDFVEGAAHGVGERIHPTGYNGYVYQVSDTGTLGPEPEWPTTEGAVVVTGSCTLTAKRFFRPVSEGPFFV